MKVSTEQLDQRVPDIQDQRAVLLLLLFQLELYYSNTEIAFTPISSYSEKL